MISQLIGCLAVGAIALGCAGRQWNDDEVRRIDEVMVSELADPAVEARTRAIAVNEMPPLAPYTPPTYVLENPPETRHRGKARRAPKKEQARPRTHQATPRAE